MNAHPTPTHTAAPAPPSPSPGELKDYMELLVRNFNPDTTETLMCTNTLNVGWDGRIFDCDFNQQLELDLRSPNDASAVADVFSIESVQDLISQAPQVGRWVTLGRVGSGRVGSGRVGSGRVGLAWVKLGARAVSPRTLYRCLTPLSACLDQPICGSVGPSLHVSDGLTLFRVHRRHGFIVTRSHCLSNPGAQARRGQIR